MVCEAMGEIVYADKGNMTKEEIDKTIGIFTEAKKNGHEGAAAALVEFGLE